MQSDTSKGSKLGYITSLRDTLKWIEVVTFSFTARTFKHHPRWKRQEISTTF